MKFVVWKYKKQINDVMIKKCLLDRKFERFEDSKIRRMFKDFLILCGQPVFVIVGFTQCQNYKKPIFSDCRDFCSRQEYNYNNITHKMGKRELLNFQKGEF